MDSSVAPALHSIQRYMVVGIIMTAFVTFGIGGWAATSQLSGAVIGQGVVVVDSTHLTLAEVIDRIADLAQPAQQTASAGAGSSVVSR